MATNEKRIVCVYLTNKSEPIVYHNVLYVYWSRTHLNIVQEPSNHVQVPREKVAGITVERMTKP